MLPLVNIRRISGHLESWMVCTTNNKFLIECVAIQYHWILDESLLVLACPRDSPIYSTDSSDIQ